MSISSVTARISELQAQLALLAPQSASGSAAAFATSLDAAAASTSVGTPGLTGTGTGTGTGGEQVVAEARKYLGVPYVWGGTNPDKGLDCSGLVQLVYRNLGHELPRVSYQQATEGKAVDGLANAKPGDLLAFGSPVHHIAIYIGDGKMIEAPRPGLDVRVTDVYETPSAVRRILPETPATAPAAGARAAASTPYADLFTSAAQKYDVSAALLSTVAKHESSFNAKAVSPAGAKGLMQLMPATARSLGVSDPFDPAQAVNGGARLLHDLLAEFGRTDLALAAYNAGPGAVHRYGGVPPYPETRNYVSSIMTDLRELGAA